MIASCFLQTEKSTLISLDTNLPVLLILYLKIWVTFSATKYPRSATDCWCFFYARFSVMKRSDVSQAKWWLLVDGARRTYYNMDYHEADGSGSLTPTSASTINLELAAGQVVRVENDQSNNVYGTDPSGTMQSWFTGFMMFAL